MVNQSNVQCSVHPSDFDLMRWHTSHIQLSLSIFWLSQSDCWSSCEITCRSLSFSVVSTYPQSSQPEFMKVTLEVRLNLRVKSLQVLFTSVLECSSNHAGLLSMQGERYMWSPNLEIIFQSISIQLIYLIANRNPNCNTPLTNKLYVTSMYSTSLEFIMEDHHLLLKWSSMFIFIFQLEMKCNILLPSWFQVFRFK